MSDWEDEPVCAVPPPAAVADDAWGDSNPNPSTNDVLGWSDEEQPAGGDGDGYDNRGRRDGAGGGQRGGDDDGKGYGGYRGRRDGDAGRGGGDGDKGGYRGHRDGEGGGYRGRRDEDGGGRGGGYRGRRDDNQDVTQLLCRGLQVPSSYDKEVVRQFLNELDLTAVDDLLKLRQLRDYLLEAFKQLVTKEWDSVQAKERNERKRKARELRDEAASSDRILNDINNMLNDRGAEQQMLLTNWLDSNMNEDELQLPTCSSDSFAAPRTPRQSRAMTRAATPVPDPLTEASRQRTPRLTRQKAGAGAGAAPRITNDSDDVVMELPSRMEELRMLLKANAQQYAQCDGNDEVYRTRVASSEQLGTSIAINAEPPGYQRWLPEDFVRRREMRNMHHINPSEMRKEIPWPVLRANNVWFSCKAPARLVFHKPSIDNNSRLLTMETQQDQTSSSLLNVPRQQQSGSRQDAQDYIRLMLDSRENEASSHSALALSNDCLPPIRSIATDGNQPILTEEDRLLMPPPVPPQTLESLMDFASVEMPPTSSENSLTPLLFRSRHAVSSTPLQDYRHQLPPIDEELAHQLNRPPTIGRVLEMSDSPATTPRPAPIANESVPVAEGQAQDIVASAVELQLTPTIPRDWNSIFRPRENMPNYEGQVVAQPKPKQKRRRPVPVHQTVDSLAAANDPRSNHEITTTFVADFLQSALQQDDPPLRQAGIVEGQPEEPFNPPAMNPLQLAEPDLELPQSIALPMELPTVMETELNPPTNNVEQVMETDLEIRQADVADKPPVLHMEMDLPMPSVSLEHLPDRAIVTSMHILVPPSEYSLDASRPQFNLTGLPGLTSECPTSAHTTLSTRLMEDSIATQQKEKSAHHEQLNRDRFYRENLDDLAFLVKNTDKLRLMVDHQKQLCDERQTLVEYSTSGEGSRRLISLPAVNTYDPKIILNMSEVKRRVAHSLMAALIMQPTVDMRSLSFITCRMEAAIAYRIILELKTVNIVNLSKDARYASLR